MNPPLQRNLVVLRTFGLLAALGFAAAFFYLALGPRLHYPYEIERLEGGVLGHVQRILEGKPIYVEPSLHFASYIYNPLYYYVSAGLAALLGLNFATLRLVSILSTLGVVAVIVAWTRRRTGSLYFGILSGGLYLAAFLISGQWFDLLRVDSLFLFFLLLGAFLLRTRRTPLGQAAAAAAMFLAFWAKQPALLVALPLSLWALACLRGGGRLVFSMLFFPGVALSAWMMNSLTHGWYRYYAFEVPSLHPILPIRLILFWMTDFLPAMPVACFFLVAVMSARRRRWRSRGWMFDALFLAGIFGSSWLSRAHSGGYVNVLMPVFAALSIYFGIGCALLTRRLAARPLALNVLYAAVLVQFFLLVYPLEACRPSELSRRYCAAMIERLRAMPGPVYLPGHVWYPVMAGGPLFAPRAAIEDILRAVSSEAAARGSRGGEIARRRGALLASIEGSIEAEEFSYIMLEKSREFLPGIPGFAKHYTLAEDGLVRVYRARRLTTQTLTPLFPTPSHADPKRQ